MAILWLGLLMVAGVFVIREIFFGVQQRSGETIGGACLTVIVGLILFAAALLWMGTIISIMEGG